MKKLILVVALSLITGMLSAQNLISTNLSAAGTYLLSTNRASVHSVQISSTTAGMLYLYDQNSVSAPYYGTNYVTSAYIQVSSFPTNIASSYVNDFGYTNWYTNSAIWTYTNTVSAATNALNPSIALAVGANIAAAYNTDALFTRGIVVKNTSTNVSVVITYR